MEYFCNVAQRNCAAGARFLLQEVAQGTGDRTQIEGTLDAGCKAHQDYSDTMANMIANGSCPAYQPSSETVIVEREA